MSDASTGPAPAAASAVPVVPRVLLFYDYT